MIPLLDLVLRGLKTQTPHFDKTKVCFIILYILAMTYTSGIWATKLYARLEFPVPPNDDRVCVHGPPDGVDQLTFF